MWNGRQRVDDARVGHLVVLVDLCPGPDPDTVGLLDAAVLDQRLGRRLAVGPHALLERPAQLGVVGLAHQVVALVVEGGVEEEPVVLELEVLVLLADAALAEGQQLLALGERPHGYGPFFERDWHTSLGLAAGFRIGIPCPVAECPCCGPKAPLQSGKNRLGAAHCTGCSQKFQVDIVAQRSLIPAAVADP